MVRDKEGKLISNSVLSTKTTIAEVVDMEAIRRVVQWASS